MPQETPDRAVVWIVDDSPLDLARAQRALVEEHSVRLFSDGSSALEALAHAPPPDVLVLDWLMPGISGLEVCRFLRSQASLPQVGVLLLTQRNETEQIVEGLKAGANDYLCKPYANEEMVARVASLLRVHRLLDRAEQAEADVRSLLDNSPDALFGIAADGRIVFANPESARMLCVPQSQLVGQKLHAVLPGISLARHDDSGGPRTLPDLSVGDRIFAPTVRHTARGRPGATTIALRDVTEQRRAESRRLDFYSVVAHDLRTPLNAMSLRLHMILSGRRGVVPSEILTDVQRIDANVRSLVAMVNDFLELARLEASADDIKRDTIEVADVVQNAVDELRPLADANNLAVAWEPPKESMRVIGDQRRLHQVVTNLVGNAIKFTPPGGRIGASVRCVGDLVEVHVSDTGPGIAPEVLPHIFERFARGPGAQGIAGSGLGLMIARQIVEAHGGTIGAESEKGRGSTFWFRLPRAYAGQQHQMAT